MAKTEDNDGDQTASLDSATMVSLFYESIFAPKSWIGLSERAFIAPGKGEELADRNKTFTREELEPVLPFLEQALTFEEHRSKTEEVDRTRADILRSLPLPVIIVDQEAGIIGATGLADQLLDAETFLRREGHRIVGPSRAFEEKLVSAISHAGKTGETTAISHLQPDGDLQMLLAAPLPFDPTGKNSTGDTRLALFFNFEFRKIDEIVPILQKAHSLTRSEAEAVAYLVQGLSLEDISREKAISVNTVRTQIKSVYAKTGARRQGELISLVMNGPGMWLHLLKTDPHEPTQRPDPYSESNKTFVLRDGRVINYGDFGPRSGTPVVLIHQLYGLRSDREEDEKRLEAAGARLIVPQRPGVGLSTPHRGLSLKSWSIDIVDLMDHLQIERFGIIGVSSGGAYAMATAAHHSDRVNQLGLIAASAPINELPDDVPVDLPRKFLTSMARHWPRGARSLLEIRMRRMYDTPEDAIRDFSERGSEADKALLKNPSIYEICLRNLKEAGEIPREVLAEEYIILARPWGFAPGDIKTPALLWHGAQDHYCSSEEARVLADLIPDSSFTLRKDWGHYFYYAEWENLLKEFVARSV